MAFVPPPLAMTPPSQFGSIALYRENAPRSGHIGPSSSSCYAAPPLRFGRFAVTTPLRCGLFAFMVFAAQRRLDSRSCAARTMLRESLRHFTERSDAVR
jgi:hypothetical protein